MTESPSRPVQTVFLNGQPTGRRENGNVTLTLPLLVVSNKGAIVMTMGRDAAEDLVKRLARCLDQAGLLSEPRCTVLVTGSVGGKERTVSLVLPRVKAALLAARLDYLSAGLALDADPNALDQ